MKNKKYLLKNLKNEVGGDFTVSLYKGRKKIANIESKGTVVSCIFDWKDEKFKKEFEQFLSEQPDRATENGVKFSEDADSFIADLLTKYERQLWLKGMMKVNTVYRLKSDREDEYNILQIPYDESVKKSIIEVNGDNLLEILNEK